LRPPVPGFDGDLRGDFCGERLLEGIVVLVQVRLARCQSLEPCRWATSV
jgi:hypothetical protein